MIKTSELKPGDHVRLVDFGKTPNEYRHRLLILGVTRGACIRVIRRAPLGCPLQIDVRGTSLILRQNEADLLRWEQV